MKVIRPPFDKWSDEDFSRALRKSFTGPPFSDAGNRCETIWSALGIRWRIRWDNAHQFLASCDYLADGGDCEGLNDAIDGRRQGQTIETNFRLVAIRALFFGQA